MAEPLKLRARPRPSPLPNLATCSDGLRDPAVAVPDRIYYGELVRVVHLVHKAMFRHQLSLFRGERQFMVAPAVRRIHGISRIVSVDHDELLLVPGISHKVAPDQILGRLRDLRPR